MLLMEMQKAIDEASNVQKRADACAGKMAQLLVGRLRSVSRGDNYWNKQALAKLKRELQDYNIRTGQWK